ncbi:hypothetical protein [Kamptonema formosum]|uniref:hypothetical protein n=1 Tax=Kamptonema formosum TaxID=331992 RepID=UPI0003762F96|nr:hypothetical protein [Oscillatoria sp. PCC 10802]
MNDGEINFLTLQFSEYLENTFAEEFFENSLITVRAGALLSLFLYAVFGFLDSCLFPDSRVGLWAIRYAIVCPFILAVYCFSFHPHFKRFLQAAISVSILGAGLGIVAMTVILPSPRSYDYYSGLILIVMLSYAFTPLRFLHSALTAWGLILAYDIAAIWLSHTPLPVLAENNFLLISSSLIGMFAAYNIELYIRRDFLQTYRLKAEREKSEQLQQQVRQLTIEIDQGKRARQVAEITETDYFQELQEKSRLIRSRAKQQQ